MFFPPRPLSVKTVPKDVTCFNKEDPTKPLVYINMTILDASGAVYKLVHSKILQSPPPGGEDQRQQKQQQQQQQKQQQQQYHPLKKSLAETIATAASTTIPSQHVATELSKKLPKQIMYIMYHKFGMRIAAQSVFVEDSFLVLKLQIQHVNSMRLLSKTDELIDRSAEQKSNGEEIDLDDDDSVATDILDEWIEEQSEAFLKEELKLTNTTTDATASSDSDSSTTTSSSDTKLNQYSETKQDKQQQPFKTRKQSPQQVRKKMFQVLVSLKDLIIAILEWILVRLTGTRFQRELERRHLPALIHTRISENLKAIMDKKLASKSLVAETAVLPEEEEARYFFTQLQSIRQQKQSNSFVNILTMNNKNNNRHNNNNNAFIPTNLDDAFAPAAKKEDGCIPPKGQNGCL